MLDFCDDVAVLTNICQQISPIFLQMTFVVLRILHPSHFGRKCPKIVCKRPFVVMTF